MKPENVIQIFVQSAIIILTALGEFFAILIAGIEIVGHAMIAIVLHLSCTLKRMPIYSVEIMFSSPVALPSDGTKTQFDYPCASAT